MKGKFYELWSGVKSSLWFVPTIMGLSAILLAILFIELDTNTSYDDLPYEWFLYAGNREGARSVLSTIASSMATIAGVTFSMILVALTLASSQYGPRLLRNFITDKSNQFVLGTFIATFIYSIIILLTIKEADDSAFIPKISIVFGFLLSIFSLGILIFFIHHIATTIQAEHIIKSSFNDLQTAINKFMYDEPAEPMQTDSIIADIRNNGYMMKTIVCIESGYLQLVNYKDLCKWADKKNIIVQLYKQPGDFLTMHEPVAALFYKTEVPDADKEIRELMIINSKRSPDQEISFSIKQIVEVAVRALSPGINDPHTAISCIHWLGAALSIIGKKHFPSIVEKNSKGEVKIIRKEYSYKNIVDTSFDQMSLYAKTNIFVTVEILDAIRKALVHAQQEALQNALFQKAASIVNQLHFEKLPKEDVDKADAGYREIAAVYERVQVK